MKKVLGMFLSLAMILTFGNISTFAEEAAGSDIVRAKQQLARIHSDEFIANFKDTAEYVQRNERIVKLVCKMQAGVLDPNAACSELESMGIYKLETVDPEQNTTIVPASEPANIKMNDVTTLYDSYTGRWLVGGGGYWQDDSAWLDDVPLNFFPTVGQSLNVGGYDGVGVKLYNTSGTYNTRLIESYAYYTAGDPTEYYNYNPSISDGSKGAYFQFQDRAIVTATTGFYSSYKYVGRNFSVMLVYDSNFSNFSGYARTQYTHTWSNAQISQVSFGANGTSPTFEVTIQNANNSFNIYSSGETRF